MKRVLFIEHMPPYYGGDVAGFEDAAADELVRRGVAIDERAPASLDQLEAEVTAAGYKGKAAKKIAQERFDGKHGEEARYLAPDEDEAAGEQQDLLDGEAGEAASEAAAGAGGDAGAQ